MIAGLVAALALPAGTITAMQGSASAQEAQPLQYVALGDSVAAGIGAGSPTANSVDGCWADASHTVRVTNSRLAYPRRVASALGAQLDFRAFCGANVRLTRTQQAQTLNAGTDLVTVQVGANDFGYADVLSFCYLWNPPRTSDCNRRINEIANKFATELPGRLNQLYRTIKKKAPNAKVVVVGYPQIVKPQSTLFCYGDGALPTSTHQALNRAGNALNSVLAARAAAHGFTFVDPRPSFQGHEVCGDPEWVNGVSSPKVESFHPNATGQEALGWLVWQAVKP
ncbi:SGNH/GDSL hydrolase family protein [Streptomyces sp. CoT10]|uniref:SGNH/GDSL hydrolase family protein n=1 Tax=Streptomyces sp. CoT10 TaxID=2875762 RepID=UPI001CD48058|nr:SGNH/GDSL hydrolase family protein [Streptomyces sp. CoT10]